MPYPSRQGTQAAVHAMLAALVDDGRDAQLLCYGEGAGPIDASYQVHRVAAAPGEERFRSGPSLRKLLSDGRLVPAVRKLRRRLPSETIVVAHHVEAAAACLIARVRPLVFFAHTSLEPELPTYAPPLAAPFLARAGRAVDLGLSVRADAVAAVAPSLAEALRSSSSAEVSYVPVPWPVPEPARPGERSEGRACTGIDDTADVVLYAGNLDGYQGWEDVIDALALVAVRRERVQLLLATDSDPAPALRRAANRGVAQRLHVAALGDERIRRRLHAAADVVVVPRRTAGGLPIKLLDALAREAPVVCTRRATAGLDLRDGAVVVADDDPNAIAGGLDIAFAAADALAATGRRGRDYVSKAHCAERFLTALDRVLEAARQRAPSQA